MSLKESAPEGLKQIMNRIGATLWHEQGRDYLVSVNVGVRKEIYDDYLVPRENVEMAAHELPGQPYRWVHTKITKIMKHRTGRGAGTPVSPRTRGRKTGRRRSYTGR
jgi:hypothetical protein